MIEKLNNLSKKNQEIELEKCCGSSKWIKSMLKSAPFKSLEKLHQKCDEIWNNCDEEDFLEAFTHHPQIGDIKSLKMKFANTSNWASNEQKGTNSASNEILQQLKSGNESYLKKFGFIFIVCATGKSARHMLNLLNERLTNNRSEELKIAATEQNKITHLRIEKLLTN